MYTSQYWMLQTSASCLCFGLGSKEDRFVHPLIDNHNCHKISQKHSPVLFQCFLWMWHYLHHICLTNRKCFHSFDTLFTSKIKLLRCSCLKYSGFNFVNDAQRLSSTFVSRSGLFVFSEPKSSFAFLTRSHYFLFL